MKGMWLRRLFPLIFTILAFLLLSACGGDSDADPDGDTPPDGDPHSDGDEEPDGDADPDADDPGDGDEETQTNDFTANFDPAALELTLSRRGETLLSFPVNGLQLGKVAAIDEGVNYDPQPLVAEDPYYTPPEGLGFLSVTAAEKLTETESGATFNLTYESGAAATLEIQEMDAGRYRVTLVPKTGQGPDLAYFRLGFTVDASEGLYGLGEYFDDVNNRGKLRTMHLGFVSEGGSETGYNDAHVPVPFLTGSRGWGLFVECPYPSVFDVATKADDRVEATFGTGWNTMDGLTFYLYAADHPLDIPKHYYETTGYPALPAPWALGPWIWRDELPKGENHEMETNVREDLQKIREQDLATSAYWIDRPYATGVNTFDFHVDWFEDAQALIDHAHDTGFRMALWHSPYVAASGDEVAADLAAVADTNGYFPPQTGLTLNKWGKPIDFTNPDAYAWWQELIQQYVDMGIEGFKLDYAEDVVPGLLGARNVWEFHDGTDERTMQSRYQIGYHKVYAETLPVEGGFIISRGGTYGDQKYTNVIWPGDIDGQLWYNLEEVTYEGETFRAVGGLPGAVVASVGLGASGYPFFGSDTGGYLNTPPDKETFTRWFQHTALSSVMQVGTNTNDVPWEFDAETGFDQEMLDWYRIYARLHLRLFPYEWTYAKNIAVDGRPIQRALGLAYPEIGEHPWDEYLFGEVLLAAPVVRRDQRERPVILPPGAWVDWWDGTVHAGGQTITEEAPLSELPLYLMQGGIVPMLRPEIDTTSPVASEYEDEIESYANDPGILYARIAPGEKSAFTLFDGATLGQERTDTGIVLESGDGETFRAGVHFELIAVGIDNTPAAVTNNDQALAEAGSEADLENAASGWFFDATTMNGRLLVRVPAGDNRVEVGF